MKINKRYVVHLNKDFKAFKQSIYIPRKVLKHTFKSNIFLNEVRYFFIKYGGILFFQRNIGLKEICGVTIH